METVFQDFVELLRRKVLDVFNDVDTLQSTRAKNLKLATRTKNNFLFQNLLISFFKNSLYNSNY